MRRDPHRLVFIHETSTTTKMVRLRGRSQHGKRLKATAPFGHWGTQTFIAGLRCDGLIAPWVLNRPINRAAFEVYIETQLAPELNPGDVVILPFSECKHSPFGQWTTYPHTKASAPLLPSGRGAPGFCFFRRALPISIQ